MKADSSGSSLKPACRPHKSEENEINKEANKGGGEGRGRGWQVETYLELPSNNIRLQGSPGV